MTPRDLGLYALIALVVGSMIGGGVFSLPQNIAASASAGAILIGWLITGIGMLALAFVYQGLSMRKPHLDAGPYAYARAGFGDFVGFNSAWGYWLSAWLGNVSYAVLIFGTLGHFFPMFGSGNTWQAVVGASLVLWLIHALILMGVRQAAMANIVTTIAKLVPIFIFVLFVLMAFKGTIFTSEFWGSMTSTAAPETTPAEGAGLGSILEQVRSTMLVTLWVFIGIEGASVVSARAKQRRDIGRATIAGFLLSLGVYMAVSLFSLGVMNQANLASLPDTASMADVMRTVAGDWGDWLIRVGLMVSVGGAFLSWTLFAAEIPYVAAHEGIMPKLFDKQNKNGSPVASLWITNGLVQLFLIITLISQSTYTALFYIASTAILVPYVLSGAYALRLALTGEAYRPGENRGRDVLVGIVATVYGCWLVYAAGLTYLLMVALLYAPGIIFYWIARRNSGQVLFRPVEALMALGLLIAASVAAWQMWIGAISPL
ncbi:MAG TPA: arginine-ornithine antiporter [Hyphomicrobiales bacterium]|nr:arginine-ornithine antiporter [Hyphomicrobiales bacterium]